METPSPIPPLRMATLPPPPPFRRRPLDTGFGASQSTRDAAVFFFGRTPKVSRRFYWRVLDDTVSEAVLAKYALPVSLDASSEAYLLLNFPVAVERDTPFAAGNKYSLPTTHVGFALLPLHWTAVLSHTRVLRQFRQLYRMLERLRAEASIGTPVSCVLDAPHLAYTAQLTLETTFFRVRVNLGDSVFTGGTELTPAGVRTALYASLRLLVDHDHRHHPELPRTPVSKWFTTGLYVHAWRRRRTGAWRRLCASSVAPQRRLVEDLLDALRRAFPAALLEMVQKSAGLPASFASSPRQRPSRREAALWPATALPDAVARRAIRLLQAVRYHPHCLAYVRDHPGGCTGDITWRAFQLPRVVFASVPGVVEDTPVDTPVHTGHVRIEMYRDEAATPSPRGPPWRAFLRRTNKRRAGTATEVWRERLPSVDRDRWEKALTKRWIYGTYIPWISPVVVRDLDEAMGIDIAPVRHTRSPWANTTHARGIYRTAARARAQMQRLHALFLQDPVVAVDVSLENIAPSSGLPLVL